RQRLILQRLCGRWLRSRGYPSLSDAARPSAASEPAISVIDRSKIEQDILRGWIAYRARDASQRFPRLAAIAKRSLGITDPSHAGATVWSESNARNEGGAAKP